MRMCGGELGPKLLERDPTTSRTRTAAWRAEAPRLHGVRSSRGPTRRWSRSDSPEALRGARATRLGGRGRPRRREGPAASRESRQRRAQMRGKGARSAAGSVVPSVARAPAGRVRATALPLDRHGRLIRERRSSDRSRRPIRRRTVETDAEHADRSSGRFERKVPCPAERGMCRRHIEIERRRTPGPRPYGRSPTRENPDRRSSGRAFRPSGERRHAAVEYARDVAPDAVEHRTDRVRSGEIGAQPVKRGRLRLARFASIACPASSTRGSRSRVRREQGDEGEYIARVGDVERQIRGNEKEIEARTPTTDAKARAPLPIARPDPRR